MSDSYQHMDPSEKGAVSFFLGMAQAKLVAHQVFRFTHLAHLDAVLAASQQPPRRHRRPDFVCYDALGNVGGVWEAKGRSGVYSQEALDKAKQQTHAIPTINGVQNKWSLASLAWFDTTGWKSDVADPPSFASPSVPLEAVLTGYYEPLFSGGADHGMELDFDESLGGYSGYLSEGDFWIGVESWLWQALRTSEIGFGEFSPQRVAAFGTQVKDAYESGETELAPAAIRRRQGHGWFTGADGISVTLGDSWQDDGV